MKRESEAYVMNLRTMTFWTAVVLAICLLGCGSKVERNIKKLEGSAEEREQAKMELTLAKQDAIEPLTRALGDVTKSPRVRRDITDVLFRLHVREEDPRILEALIPVLNDGDPTVRAGAATALGDMGKDKAISPLVDALEKEQDDEVIYQILVALETLGTQILRWDLKLTSEKMEKAEGERFVRFLKRKSGQGSEKVQRKVREWLETIAEEMARKADQLVLKGSLEEAEKRYFEAKALVPDSKNINYKLGRFYFDNDDEQKGLDIFTEYGMVAYAKRLSPAPIIDGVLDDPCWKPVKPLTTFYQGLQNMTAYPIKGKSEAYVGYANGSLFVGIKGYEPSTKTLTAREKRRDMDVHKDDCVEMQMDTNHDYRSYYHLIVNTLGTISDSYNQGGRACGDPSWNGDYTIATAVEDTFWVCEIEIPFKQVGNPRVRRGTLWGFNVARVRIGNASEYGQWMPTYGTPHRPGRFGFLFFE